MTGDLAWCPRCSRRREVTDEHGESFYDGGSEFGYVVRNLSCDHEVSTQPSTIGRSPGAPYAGRATAASHHPADLARANQQGATDE